MNAEAIEDAVLVQQALAGEARAFDQLVERYHPPAMRYARRLLGTREEAEEAVQDAFLRAYQALARYDERDRFRSWLFRILVNRCRTRLKRLRRRWGMFAPLEGAEEPGTATAPVPDGAAADLDRLIGGLGEEQREAFLLRYVQDLSYEEMSAMTGAGVSALKMRVKRACDALRARLGGDR